jgi:hypothetical protein
LSQEPKQFFRIKNWDKYQDFHHKNREGVPPWIKLSTAFFDDAGLADLPDSQRLCWVALLIHAAKCRNRLPYDAAFVRQRYGLRRAPDLDLFLTQGFIEICDVLEERRVEERREEENNTGDVAAVFAHWQGVMGKPASVLTPERKRLIAARLKEGYSVADLKRAVDGNKGSKFHQGENDRKAKYDDLTLICRSGEKVEQFRDMVKDSVLPPAESPIERRRRMAEESAKREAN